MDSAPRQDSPAEQAEQAELQSSDISYPALFMRFLRFGLLAFGGPVAQFAMIRRELVDEEVLSD